MNTTDIRLLYEYNNWANDMILTAVSPLTAEQLVQDMGGSFRSVRDTLVHILAAEWIWLERWNGNSPSTMLDAAEFANLDQIRARWSKVERERGTLLERLTDDSLRELITYRNLRGQTASYSLGHMMQHVANHSTYHRGQVVSFLRQLGAKAPSTDFVRFIDAKESRAT